MLEAEYEYYRNNDFNAAMTLFKRALEINNFQPIFISASEICSIENRFDVYEDLAKNIITMTNISPHILNTKQPILCRLFRV